MNKVIVFGGGTGLSCLLEGLKLFPMDVSTVITVSDNGSSTGLLKEELDIPAVGDIGKVLLSMANVDDDYLRLLRYRFKKEGSLYNHPVRNILLAALIDLKGNLYEATDYMSNLLQIRGRILPITEEKIDLVGVASDREFFGEEAVSENMKRINRLRYDHNITINRKIIDEIREADLIIFSPGSLYTSIIPHLLSTDIVEALENARAPIMYVANLVTQPGETDDRNLSAHIKVLNSYLGKRRIDIVVANNSEVDQETADRYLRTENKEMLIIDEEEIDKLMTYIVAGNILHIDEEGKIRHNSLKTAYLIFSYLMEHSESTN